MAYKQIPSAPELFSHGYRFQNGELYRVNGSAVAKTRNKSGHLSWQIRVDGKPKFILVHRFMCQYYWGEPSHSDLEVNHKDGDPSNNSAPNLEWCTHSENQLHARHVLGKEIGSAHHNAKLDRESVDWILWSRACGIPGRVIAASIGISPSTVCDIAAGRTWGHGKN